MIFDLMILFNFIGIIKKKILYIFLKDNIFLRFLNLFIFYKYLLLIYVNIVIIIIVVIMIIF